MRLGIALPGNTRKQKPVDRIEAKTCEEKTLHKVETEKQSRLNDKQVIHQSTIKQVPAQTDVVVNAPNPFKNNMDPIKPKIIPKVRSEKPATKPLHLGECFTENSLIFS